MKVKLQVVAQDHQTWPQKGDRQAGESYNFMCMDMSQPPQERMTMPMYYRLSVEEKLKYWDKSFDKTFDVVLQGLGQLKNGRVVFNGFIIETGEKKG